MCVSLVTDDWDGYRICFGSTERKVSVKKNVSEIFFVWSRRIQTHPARRTGEHRAQQYSRSIYCTYYFHPSSSSIIQQHKDITCLPACVRLYYPIQQSNKKKKNNKNNYVYTLISTRLYTVSLPNYKQQYNMPILIKVLLFASAREAAGNVASVELELSDDGADTASLR